MRVRYWIIFFRTGALVEEGWPQEGVLFDTRISSSKLHYFLLYVETVLHLRVRVCSYPSVSKWVMLPSRICSTKYGSHSAQVKDKPHGQLVGTLYVYCSFHLVIFNTSTRVNYIFFINCTATFNIIPLLYIHFSNYISKTMVSLLYNACKWLFLILLY